MGGTWVFWGQANVWREIARYGMQDDLEISYDFSRGINKYLLSSPQGVQSFSHEEEVIQILAIDLLATSNCLRKS